MGRAWELVCLTRPREGRGARGRPCLRSGQPVAGVGHALHGVEGEARRRWNATAAAVSQKCWLAACSVRLDDRQRRLSRAQVCGRAGVCDFCYCRSLTTMMLSLRFVLQHVPRSLFSSFRCVISSPHPSSACVPTDRRSALTPSQCHPRPTRVFAFSRQRLACLDRNKIKPDGKARLYGIDDPAAQAPCGL